MTDSRVIAYLNRYVTIFLYDGDDFQNADVRKQCLQITAHRISPAETVTITFDPTPKIVIQRGVNEKIMEEYHAHEVWLQSGSEKHRILAPTVHRIKV